MDELNDQLEIDSNKGCLKEDFREISEVNLVINNIIEIVKNQTYLEKSLERFTYIVNQYQEQPHLLDPHLKSLFDKLFQLIKLNINVNQPVVHLAFKFLYLLTKTRGYKVVSNWMPHEVTDLEPLLTLLYREDPDVSINFETKYVLLLWLSIVCLVPFELRRFDLNMTSYSIEKDKKENEEITSTNILPIMDRILNICKAYLNVDSRCQVAAAYVIAKFMTRPDVIKARIQVYIQSVMHDIAILQTTVNVVQVTGILLSLSYLFKHAKRDDLLIYAPEILISLRIWSLSDSRNTLLRRLHMKVVQRVGLVLLKPRLASWRYKRGKRSLVANLTTSKGSVAKDIITTPPIIGEFGDTPTINIEIEDIEDSGMDDNYVDDEEGEYEIPDDIEEVLEKLISGLKDKESIVRWSAAKGIGRVTGRLPMQLADEVLSSVMELFAPTENEDAWHGGCLCLAELGHRGLLLPKRFKEVVRVVVLALNYEERRGLFSVGSNVRDSACYVCWSFARAYDSTDLKPYVDQIAEALIVVMLFDREINVRRAASAAFQENVGRQGQFPNGIDIVTYCDYFAVGNRVNCYSEISKVVAAFGNYKDPLLNHLFNVKFNHWDINLRELTGEAIHVLIPVDITYVITKGIPFLLSKCLDVDQCTRHGAIICLAQAVHALSTLDEYKENINSAFGEDIINSCLNLINELKEGRFFRGVSGDMMRQACCLFIGKLSLAKFPNNLESILEDWQSVLDDSLQNASVKVQSVSINAIAPFVEAYLISSPEKLDKLISNYINGLCHETLSHSSRCGYALALGSLPGSVFMEPNCLQTGVNSNVSIVDNRFDKVLSCLLKHATYNVNSRQQCCPVEVRRDSIKAIMSTLENMEQYNKTEKVIANKTISCFELNFVKVSQIYEKLFSSIQDYTLDDRGDIGSCVREATMNCLYKLTIMLAESQPTLITPQICHQLFCHLLQQACEKIDKTRALAGNIFAKLLYSDFKVPHIPCISDLQIFFPLSEINSINWASPSNTFVRYVRLLELKDLSYHVLLGIAISAGGLSESLQKHAATCLQNYAIDVLSLNPASLSYFLELFIKILKDHRRQDRIIGPLFKTLDKLLASECFLNLPYENKERLLAELFNLTENEVIKSRDVVKILSALDVFCGIRINFLSNYIDKSEENKTNLAIRCLNCLISFLLHRFPIIRRGAASKLYECLLMSDITPFEIVRYDKTNDSIPKFINKTESQKVESIYDSCDGDSSLVPEVNNLDSLDSNLPIADQVTELLSETAWDLPVEDLRPIVTRMRNLLHLVT